jgi:hypothetical protein
MYSWAQLYVCKKKNDAKGNKAFCIVFLLLLLPYEFVRLVQTLN